MKVLLLGGSGQLGQSVQEIVPATVELYAPSRAELDLQQTDRVRQCIGDRNIAIVLNCSAYTNVEGAESETVVADAVNHQAVAGLVEAVAASSARVVHVSTDYVFDGRACHPYEPAAATNPQCAYGRSKLAGEVALQKGLPGRHSIIRTSWLYSASGNNFMLTMLRLMAEREELSVVADQVGTPTHCAGLAGFLWWVAEHKSPPVMHWSDCGVASWYDFAVAIMEEALETGVLECPILIRPINSADYPQQAARPPYSVLDSTASYQLSGLPQHHWREGLRATLSQLVNQR